MRLISAAPNFIVPALVVLGLIVPGQANGGACSGGNAFLAAGEAEPFAGRGFHGNARDVDPADLGDARTHGVAQRADTDRDVGALLYQTIARPWVASLNHLPEFYFRPGLESPAGFLVRNLWNLFNFFSPALLWSPRRAAALVLLFVGAALLVPVAVVVGRGWRSAWWSRRSEIAEAVSGSFAVASLVVAVGFFRYLWELTS